MIARMQRQKAPVVGIMPRIYMDVYEEPKAVIRTIDYLPGPLVTRAHKAFREAGLVEIAPGEWVPSDATADWVEEHYHPHGYQE